MLPSYVEQGLRLERIATSKTYREEGYRTLKEYCRQGLGISHVQAFRLRKAAKLTMELGVTLPTEYHCRLLAKLPPAQRLELVNSFDLEAMPETILACLINVKLGRPVSHPSENGRPYNHVKAMGHRLSTEERQYLRQRLLSQYDALLATGAIERLPTTLVLEAWNWAWDEKLAIDDRLARLRRKQRAQHSRELAVQINGLRRQKARIAERIEKLDERLLQNAQKTWEVLCDGD